MSRHPKPGGNKPHPDPNNHGTNNQKRSITGDLHVRGEIVTVPAPEETLARKTHNDKQETNDTIKRRMEYAMLAVVTIYTFFAGWQGGSSAGQLKEARKVTELTDNNFRASQRAWIGVDRFEFVQLQPEKPIIWQTTLKNFGNSPAKSVAIMDTAKMVVSSKVDPTMAWMLAAGLPKVSGQTVTMFNGQIYTDHGGVSGLLTASQIDDINHGRSILIYIAEIKYTDIFDKTHTTMVCQVMDSIETHGCGFGETAD